jgi:hypothetical protein
LFLAASTSAQLGKSLGTAQDWEAKSPVDIKASATNSAAKRTLIREVIVLVNPEVAKTPRKQVILAVGAMKYHTL